MLNIRMSRTPIEGSAVRGCFTPWLAHILMWSRIVSACIPILVDTVTGPIECFLAGQSPLRGRQRVEYLEECMHSPHGWPTNVE
jgi:hypothetical protein